MKLIFLFLSTVQFCFSTDFHMYHCKYISSKALVQKLSIFTLKGKYTPSNHSTIVFFGQKTDFDKFQKFASKFDIKAISVSGEVSINMNQSNSSRKTLEYSKNQQSQFQKSSFRGLSGSNIKVQLGKETVRQFQDLYQISNTGLYLNLIATKIGQKFQIEISIKATTLSDQTLFTSQTLLVNERVWTPLTSFQNDHKSTTKSLSSNLQNLIHKQSSLLNLNAQILIQEN